MKEKLDKSMDSRLRGNVELKPTKPLSGFIELLPAQQRFFDDCAARMQNVLRLAGFSYLDLPAIERAEVLTDAEDWDETATQMFLFQKGDTKMGLRYDGTVGLARYVAGHLNDLTFPFRATQFSKRYRGERPQKGRYREFYQMDLDILGQGDLSQNYEAELIAVWEKLYNAIPELVGGYTINIGNRNFWNALAEYLQLTPAQTTGLFALVDKREKMPEQEFKNGIIDVVGNDNGVEILNVFSNGYLSFLNKSDNLDTAIKELQNFDKLLSEIGVKNYKINIGVMRGLGYYDGIVYEAYSSDYPELGSIGGGGRYGNLTGKFSKSSIIGAGLAIGVSRLAMVALESGRVDLSKYESPIMAAVLVMGATQVPFAMNFLSRLRDEKIASVPYLDTDKKFKNQIEFADKIKSKFSIIIGEDEVKSEKLTVKNMTTGEQQKLAPDCVLQMLKSVKK
ncbi:MAG: histidine--tRNA ligase [Rickettsiales bacterium]|jgi:histidyl-tRNA synthetase|nr:histidine--tRNA ligase [Rickettsiales bacterium]